MMDDEELDYEWDGNSDKNQDISDDADQGLIELESDIPKDVSNSAELPSSESDIPKDVSNSAEPPPKKKMFTIPN